MGAPLLEPRHVPIDWPGERVVEAPFMFAGERLLITAVSMGNPHAVAFVDAARSLEDWATTIGPVVERHPLFPKRTNVEFARLVAPDAIDLVVWERGAGLTQACGTGACATAVAAVLTGRTAVGIPVRIRLPGGELRVQVEPGLSRVWMTGPAVEVFSGAVA
jgi:diaminopimelate epimerase